MHLLLVQLEPTFNSIRNSTRHRTTCFIMRSVFALILETALQYYVYHRLGVAVLAVLRGHVRTCPDLPKHARHNDETKWPPYPLRTQSDHSTKDGVLISVYNIFFFINYWLNVKQTALCISIYIKNELNNPQV